MEQKKQWQKPAQLRLSPELIAAAGDSVVAEILFRRGYQTPEAIRAFIDVDASSPVDFGGHPLVVPLVDRIEQALVRGEHITVYGDYDVDGITSTAVWVDTLRHLGGEVSYHVPDRFEEGYGINVAVLEQLALAGTRLIITCDCGISNINEIAAARQLGLDVLITDHHELPDALPDVPTFNPKMLEPEHPAYWIPGVGASYVVAREVLKRFGKDDFAEELLEFLALGIIADVVPLTKDNRWYLRQGLPRLLKSKRPGLRTLLALAKINPVLGTEEDIAFQVIPRLNAAGRLDSARSAVDLLLCSDEEEARELAAKLDRLNETRKTFCDRMMRDAVAQVYALPEQPLALVLYQENWPEGVIGVVAGRLAEQFEKPVFLMTSKENGLITGSARSVAGMNVFQALSACREVLEKFGGHEGAAGFSLTLDNIDVLRQRLEQVVSSMKGATVAVEALTVDALLPVDRINVELYRRIRQLAPFGPENPQPIFMVDGQITANQLMKEGSLHRRLRVAKHKVEVEGVWWHSAGKKVEAQARVVARLRLNLYRDITIQLDVQDVVADEDCLNPLSFMGLRLVDQRGGRLELLQTTYPNAVFFDEGQELLVQQITADTLVLLTIPADWEKVWLAVRPRQIVIAWDQQPREWNQVLETTWQQLLGLIKYAVRVYDGCITLERVATQLNITRDLVLAGIMVLEEAGLIQMNKLDALRVSVNIRQHKLLSLRNLACYQRFTKMLAELEAYRCYLRCLPVEQLAQFLQVEDCRSA